MLNEYKNNGIEVWCFNNNYESEIRNAFGEKFYQQYCQKFPGYTKAVKAKLMAMDNDIGIPDFILPITKWLSNQDVWNASK